MKRTSTFKMAVWIIIFVGSALSVKTLRHNTSRQLTSLTSFTRKASTEAVHISQIARTLLLP